MPAVQMDALGAFTHLSENLPNWISRLSELSSHTTAKHAEYAQAYKRHTTVRPRRRKNSSACSIRTEDLYSSAPDTEPYPQSSAADTQADTAVTTPTTSQHQPNVNPRKRGAEEAASLDSCDSNPYVSTRHNLIIHYDGHTQKTLEELVRNIGTARNNIRKGRVSQSVRPSYRRSLLGKAPMMDDSSTASPMGPDSAEDVLFNIRRARNRKPPTPQSQEPSKESAFDTADKLLELVHGMCETAAYHFLRSGDCSSELTTVEARFKTLLELATAEVDRLKAEQSGKPAAQEESPPTERIASITTTTGKPLLSKEDDEIEVDDGTGSIESIDLAAFRVNRLRR
ncbi:hypothetical protein BO71DRAFT_396393 [Aspergillus ellipticus CBS 707.79]|uniref:Uncharacterized protein n=1 Tax=Aspergillus ellipticus CBS 707.79 TaxID=1448320 RepID=A0A319DIH1_9EURO|nr:hypothetical protein BO71DRAFT_396393 [Aspergillus ellipticus CBS 707.79]